MNISDPYLHPWGLCGGLHLHTLVFTLTKSGLKNTKAFYWEGKAISFFRENICQKMRRMIYESVLARAILYDAMQGQQITDSTDPVDVMVNVENDRNWLGNVNART